MKKFLIFPMNTANIPPVDPAPAARTAALAMHTGHMVLPSNASFLTPARSYQRPSNLQMLGNARLVHPPATKILWAALRAFPYPGRTRNHLLAFDQGSKGSTTGSRRLSEADS